MIMLRRLLASRRWRLVDLLCLLLLPTLLSVAALHYTSTSAASVPTSLKPITIGSSPAPSALAQDTRAIVSLNLASSEAAAFAKGSLSTTTTTTPALTTASASSATAAPSTTEATAPPSTTTTTQPAPPEFHASVSAIDQTLGQKMQAAGIWNPGAPVGLSDLRLVMVSYWDFDGRAETGSIIVNQAWATQLTKVFKTLFDAHFPLRGMNALVPVTNDGPLGVVDNTRSFQSRRVNGGWSMHAYGLAVDINPGENPWVRGGAATPGVGAKFADRTVDAPGVVKANGIVAKAFAAIGWTWGGSWSGSKDYMHFSSNGH